MKTKKITPLLSLLFFISLVAQAAKVDTVKPYSQSMTKKIKAVVITPDSYNGIKTFPVV